MAYQWGSIPGGNKKERRGKRADLPEEVAKKLKSCSVLECENWRDLNNLNTTYHCFPTGDKNQQRWEIWTSLLQKSRDDATWIPFRGSLVCSNHFRSEDFVQDPNQKRRKLVKNAIPSIFPTFIVDLDDPSFVLEDSNDAPTMMDNGENDNDTGTYYNDYNEDYDQEPEMVMPEVNVTEYPPNDDEEEDIINEDDLQYAAYHPPRKIKHQTTMISSNKNKQPPPPLPKLTPATNSYIRESTNEAEYYHEPATTEPPPRKKMSIKNGSQPQQTYSNMNGRIVSNKKPPLSFKGAYSTSFTNAEKSGVGSNNGRGFSNNNSTKTQNTSTFPNGNNNNQNSSSTSKLYQQLCKSMPNTKFPMSWNSDLEIEVVQTNNNDSSTISSLKQRVDELETENETLKLKFSAQIRALQRKIKEQDKIINEYVAHFTSIGEDS